MIVSIYGNVLAAETAGTTGTTLPLQLSDAQVLLDGTPVPLYYVSPSLVNIFVPNSASGLVRLGVQNTLGSHTVNALVEAAAPSIFTQDSSGKGAAAALHAGTSTLVTTSSPLHGGDYLELFLTGLGRTKMVNGLDYANQVPTVTIAGQDCPVIYAGRAPGYPGLDQINCLIPSGLPGNDSAPLTVTSGARTSNVVTIAIQ